MTKESREQLIQAGVDPDDLPATDLMPVRQITGAGQTMVQAKTSYITAVQVQKPRQLELIIKGVLEEAQYAGSDFYYGWKVKNKKTGRDSAIEGASIGLATALFRHYGNCAMETSVTETTTHYLFTSTFIDLERGISFPRLYRQRIKENIGAGYEDERAADVVFQIGQSKSQRNAIVKAMPEWMVKQAIERAKEAELNKLTSDNIVTARVKALTFFIAQGVTLAQIENYLDRPLDMWTKEDIIDLRAVGTAINEGRGDVKEIFSPSADEGNSADEQKKPPSTLETMAKDAKANGKPKLEPEQPKPEPPEAAAPPETPQPRTDDAPPPADVPIDWKDTQRPPRRGITQDKKLL